MIKKILLGLLALIIVVIIGLVCLVFFVDPNNFRGFISQTVKDKTGYELKIEGDLRWHVWPQISILSDAIRLEDDGAKKPVLSADNMRLDVELFPLFSKQLSVKNILVKSAVINLTDESKGKVAQGHAQESVTVNQQQSEPVRESNKSNWSFSLNKLEIADSTVVLQTANQDMVNFRDINITVYQKDEQNMEVDLSGSINRDQRDLTYNLNANANLANYPNSVSLVLNKFNYSLSGVGIAKDGIKGNITANISYNASPLVIKTGDLAMTVNDNKLSGQLSYAQVDNKPTVDVAITSEQVDLTPFMASSDKPDTSAAPRSAPVVTAPSKGNELAFLNGFDLALNLQIKSILANKLAAQNIVFDVVNKSGIATINKAALDIAKGHISATGSANGKQAQTAIKLDTKITNVELGDLLNQLDIAHDLTGTLNGQADITANTIRSDAVLHDLNGDVNLVINDARLNNLNIQQIIQSAVAKFSKNVISPELQEKYTEFHTLSGKGHLSQGQLNLSSIVAASETLDVNGTGLVDLLKKDLDVNFNVKVLGGWNGKSETIAQLQKITIPFRIYGEFSQLHYQLDVNKILKDQLKDQLQEGLDKLRERYLPNTNKSDGSAESSQEEQGNSSSSRIQRALDLLKK